MPKRKDISIKGIQELQAYNIRAIAALHPAKAIRYGTDVAHRYAVAITHVITGSLRAAHRIKIHDTYGTISIDPRVRNPRTGQKPSEYGVTEHERGGSHAFYRRTVEEKGGRIGDEVLQIFIRGLS